MTALQEEIFQDMLILLSPSHTGLTKNQFSSVVTECPEENGQINHFDGKIPSLFCQSNRPKSNNKETLRKHWIGKPTGYFGFSWFRGSLQ
jgi:hypothetical protein